jgi:translation initiation factor 1
MKPPTTYRGVVLRKPAQAAAVRAAGHKSMTPGTSPGGRVRVGRQVAGRGGKGVTVISGVPYAAAQLEELATRLKKLCGAGGAVREGVIEIQGEHRDRLVAELCKLGLEAKRSGG